MISTRHATLRELETYYGIADLYAMLEIICVDAHNQRVVNDRNRPQEPPPWQR